MGGWPTSISTAGWNVAVYRGGWRLAFRWGKPTTPPRARVVGTYDVLATTPWTRKPGHLYMVEPLTPNTNRITVWKADT